MTSMYKSTTDDQRPTSHLHGWNFAYGLSLSISLLFWQIMGYLGLFGLFGQKLGYMNWLYLLSFLYTDCICSYSCVAEFFSASPGTICGAIGSRFSIV